VVADLHGPHLTTDRVEILDVHDLLVAQELRPCRVWRFREIVRGALALAVPAPRRLRGAGPEERIARVNLTEDDHVPEKATSSRASARMRTAPSSSGSHPVPSSAAGERPSSCVRRRWNQRRTPMSLYEPARSPTTSARKCRRAATSSGVSR